MEGSVSAVKLTLTVQKVETQLVILSGKPVNPRKKPLYVKSQLNLGGSAPKPQGRVIVRVNGKEVGSGKIGKRIKLKVRGLPVGRHAAFAHYTGDDYTLPNTTPMHEVVVTSKTTAFVMPYTAVRPTLRPPITSVTTPIATLGGHYGSVTGGSYSSVSYSYNGDLSTDARVNADDYFRIDGFMSQAAGDGAAGGELNFDSGIDADDYYLIDQAFLGGE